jgi:hypothetical protein
MQSIADGLPPEVAQQIHPDWRRNEKDYWANRDRLIAQYRDRWIAFANGAVVSSGTTPVEVFHAAQQSGLHPYVTCVGREHEPCRMRRAVVSYDRAYTSEPLPLTLDDLLRGATDENLHAEWDIGHPVGREVW